jgi:hypothetical protein
MRRTLAGSVAIALSLAIAAPLIAGPDDLVRAITAARADSQNPIGTFLTAFAALPDTDLTGDQFRRALRDAGVPSEPTGDKVLGHIVRFQKTHEKITITNDQKAATEIVVDGDSKGVVTLDRVVTLNVKKQGDTVTVDGFNGLQLSKKVDSFKVSLKRLVITKENGKNVAKVTAGLAWPLQKTVTIDLSDPTNLAGDGATATASGPPTQGMLGGVPH